MKPWRDSEPGTGASVCGWRYLQQWHGRSHDGIQAVVRTSADRHLVLFGLVQSGALDLQVLLPADHCHFQRLFACSHRQTSKFTLGGRLLVGGVTTSTSSPLLSVLEVVSPGGGAARSYATPTTFSWPVL